MANFFDQFDAGSEPTARITVTKGPDYSGAISSIESGGNYRAVGPNTGKGRALGKYQVMDFNVGPWSEEVLGQRLTPMQFLASPEAQDAVFNAKFGSYAQKYGPEGAARAWFAGEGGMNNPSARDVLGTSVADYANKFNTAMGFNNERRPVVEAAQAAMPKPGNFFDQFDGKPAPAAPPGFDERFAPVIEAAPQNAEALSAGLRSEADRRIVRQGYGRDPQPGEAEFDSAVAEWANTALLNVPRNIGAATLSFRFGVPFNEAYERLKDFEEARSRLNPVSSGVGTAGGIVQGAVTLPGIGGGASTVGRAGRAGATAGGYSAASSLIDSKDPLTATVAGGLGAGLGFVAAPVAEKIVGLVTRLVQRGAMNTKFLNNDGTLTPEAMKAARDAGIEPGDFQTVLVNAYGKKFSDKGASPATAREAAADEFGITLTPGQATGDFSRIKYEQDAARGGYGPLAAKAARNRFEEQGGQIGAARSGIQSQIAGEQPMVGSVDEAAGSVLSGVKSAAAKQRADFKGKYQDALTREGEFSDIAFRGVGDRIKVALSDGDNPVIIDDVTTPIANRAIADLDRISGLRIQNSAAPGGQPDPAQIVGVNLRGVDQARKRLVAFYQSAKGSQNASDARAVQRIIDGFDNEVEMAMQTGLFSGDDAALSALKAARESYRKYRQTFKPGGAGDDVGRSMERIAERDATAGEVANLLYGHSAIGERGVSARLANRMKQVFGEGSDEWSAIKQGLWMRLTSKPEGMNDFGPQAMSERIFKFVNGDGAALARQVFSPEEIGQIKRFAAAVKNVVPPRDAVNWSGTAYTLAALQGGGLGGAGLYFGADPQTAAALASLRIGGKVAKDIVRGRSASKYFSRGAPSTLPPPGAGATPGVGVGVGLGAGQYE